MFLYSCADADLFVEDSWFPNQSPPHTSLCSLPALTAGGCSWYPVSWHQPTGYRSGDSQSTHWSYSSSQPSKCIRSNRWTMRVTVATQTSRGSMRSTASSFIPGRKPWLGTSWSRKKNLWCLPTELFRIFQLNYFNSIIFHLVEEIHRSSHSVALLQILEPFEGKISITWDTR